MSTSHLAVAACARSFRTTIAVLACATLFQSVPAEVSAASITITANPPALSVLEGQSGVFDFTVTNISAADIVVVDVRYVGGSMASSIHFLAGDPNDEVFFTEFMNEGNCEGKTLSANQSCVFQQLFQTRDTNPAAPATNVGLWEILNAVDVSDGIIVDSAGATAVGSSGSAIVEVRDAGAVSAIPEPSTLLLLGSGVVWIAARAKRRY